MTVLSERLSEQFRSGYEAQLQTLLEVLPPDEPMVLEGRASILSLVEASGLTNAEICRRAGVSPNTICNMKYNKRGLMWTTTRALIEALGYRIVVLPE